MDDRHPGDNHVDEANAKELASWIAKTTAATIPTAYGTSVKAHGDRPHREHVELL